jgi:hypothetical protein
MMFRAPRPAIHPFSLNRVEIERALTAGVTLQ